VGTRQSEGGGMLFANGEAPRIREYPVRIAVAIGPPAFPSGQPRPPGAIISLCFVENSIIQTIEKSN